MQDIDLFMGQAVDEPEDVSTGTPS
jgi:hypothetical protein